MIICTCTYQIFIVNHSNTHHLIPPVSVWMCGSALIWVVCLKVCFWDMCVCPNRLDKFSRWVRVWGSWYTPISYACPRVGVWGCGWRLSRIYVQGSASDDAILRQSGMRVNWYESVWPIWEGACLMVLFPAYRDMCPRVGVRRYRSAHVEDLCSVFACVGLLIQKIWSKGRCLRAWVCAYRGCIMCFKIIGWFKLVWVIVSFFIVLCVYHTRRCWSTLTRRNARASILHVWLIKNGLSSYSAQLQHQSNHWKLLFFEINFERVLYYT